MDAYFFRVDHDLLRSLAFKSLGGSAIKVYLVLGLYSDFGTGWGYPSIRTIARQAGLSRQTVLTAIQELTESGLVATQKSAGRSNAYRIIRQAPQRPRTTRGKPSEKVNATGPISLEEGVLTSQENLESSSSSVPRMLEVVDQFVASRGRQGRPNPEQLNENQDDTTSAAIPGTPFRMTADGRLLVAVDLHQLLTGEGLPKRTAERLLAQKDPESVAKVLLNAFYLRSQGKLQNGPGYIRAGIEAGYELLPQVANRLETKRRELQSALKTQARLHQTQREKSALDEEEAAIKLVLERLEPEDLESLVARAVESLPSPLVRHNPTLSNPFVRTRVYELAGGEPVE